MPILRRDHGSALSVVTCTHSNIGRFESSLRRRLKPRSSEISAGRLAWRKEASKMPKLFLVNIPYNYSERELQEWLESRGLQTRSLRIVHDLMPGLSPYFGYVESLDHIQ